jgi:hypothetical protein
VNGGVRISRVGDQVILKPLKKKRFARGARGVLSESNPDGPPVDR